MKTPITMSVLAFACAVSLALLAGCLASAQYEMFASSLPKGVSPGGTQPLQPEWRLGPAIRHDNLTLFPVLSDDVSTTDEFITLDEGLRAGTVTITELAAAPRPPRSEEPASARLPQIQQPANAMQRPERNNRTLSNGSDGAQVNKLAITNRSGKTLVLIAGEIVTGGKQDRVFSYDAMVAPTGQPVPLDVFCVEHGRWNGSAAFNANASGSAAPTASGGNQRTAGDAPSQSASAEIVTPMALPDVRGTAQAKKSQSEVWKTVADTAAANNVSTQTGTLNAVYKDGGVKKRIGAFESSLRKGLRGSNVIGVVAAVGGKIISADVFANSGLFRAYWPKLLKSYALQAISAGPADGAKPSMAAASAFLAHSQGSGISSEQEGLFRRKEHQSDADASFELQHYDKGRSKLVHFNKVSKK